MKATVERQSVLSGKAFALMAAMSVLLVVLSGYVKRDR